jgi:hypothetical protein
MIQEENAMERNSLSVSVLWGLSIGIGIALAGLVMSNALYKARTAERYVSVRGLAEREVDADLVIWPITFKEAGNDLVELQKRIDEKREIISAFLESNGFKREDISYSAPRITDTQAERYEGGKSDFAFRYVAQATVTLRSHDVASVKKTIEQSGVLVGKGVVLAEETWENRTQFLFTGLNKIKPEMIEAATRNAREAAIKFAKDSGSEVGKIRKATQGLFEINDRDPNSPDRKLVRVVTTVEYYLVDK